MRNTYTQGLYTGVNILCNTPKSTRNYCMYLTRPIRSMLVGEPLRRIARKRCLALLAGLLLFGNMPTVQAINTPRDINTYKLYAHMKLLDAKQYRCVELLWTRESLWNPRAKNPKSSAYGIPQMLRMKERDPYLQIDLGLKYIKHKHGTPCKAWELHKRKGWY